jgi:hypothetical protein
VEAIDLVRQQYKGAHDLLEVTLKDVTDEQAHWAPPGVANPLGATYVHVVVGEDALLSTVARQSKPLFLDSFAGKIGVDKPPPGPGQGLDEWARGVKVDLAQAKEYAKAVYASTDAYLASLTSADLDEPIDMSRFGMGQQPRSTLVAGIVLQHINNHCGEISCLKGLQGAKGYPF